MEMSLIPGGTRNGVSGLSFRATVMKSRKIGAANCAAWAWLPSERGRS